MELTYSAEAGTGLRMDLRDATVRHCRFELASEAEELRLACDERRVPESVDGGVSLRRQASSSATRSSKDDLIGSWQGPPYGVLTFHADGRLEVDATTARFEMAEAGTLVMVMPQYSERCGYRIENAQLILDCASFREHGVPPAVMKRLAR